MQIICFHFAISIFPHFRLIKMNLWPQFLQSLLLMLMRFQFGCAMDDGQLRKTSRLLNPNATPFYPRGQFISTVPVHQHSPIEEQHEALLNLPDYLFDWEDKIEDNRQEREEVGTSLHDDLNPREKEEASSNQDEGTHLAPNPKLSEGENPSEVREIKIDSVQQEAKRTMKFGSFPEILLTGEKDELNKLLGQKDQKKDQLLTVKTDKSQSSTSFKSEKEKHHPHLQSIEKKAEEEERKTQEVAQLEYQNTAKLELELNRKIALGGKEEIKSTASSKSSDILSNKKLLQGESILSTDKDMPAKSLQKSSTSSSRGKEKQQHPHQKAQPTNPAGDNNIPRGNSGSIASSHSHPIHKQSNSKIEQKFTPTVKTISPRIMEEKTAEDSLVKTSETGKDLMEHEEFVEEIKYNQLRTDQTTKELIDEKIVNDEQTGKPENTNQDQRSRQTGQSSKGKSRKNRPTAQSSKGKNAITSVEKEAEKLKKEEDENELLHQFKKVADEERLKIEKQKQTEIEKRIKGKEKLKMYEEKEEEQSRKQMLDNLMGGTDKSVKMSDLSTAPSDSIITNVVVVQGHGETSDSYGIAGGDIVNETFFQPKAVIPAPADASFRVKGEKKFKQIKDLLKKMKENLKELKLFENNWIEEKSRKLPKLNYEINNKEKEILKNLKQYKSSKVQIIIEVNKWERMADNFADLKNQKYLKKKNLETREKLLKVMKENMMKQREFIDNLGEEIEKLIKFLFEEFIKMNLPETEEIKMIEKKMEEPMRNLWNLYNLVLLALNQVWNEPGFRNHHGFKLPYHYIDYIFHKTPLSITQEEQSEFYYTMKLTMEKMLLHQNIYRTMHLNGGNGKSVSIFERLKCFDELSEKLNLLDAADGDEFSETNLEFLMKFGKFIKEQVNKHIREAFRFIMVGLDEVPDVSDQMALDGIKRLSQWLPQNRKRQMDEIWMRLFKYYELENKNLNILSQVVNDEWAHIVFDLMPADKEEQNMRNIRKQLSKIDELYREISEEFSKEIIKFMKNVVFSNIEQLIQSINMLLKIEKRANDAKPLPYLKSVYDKYWYKIYKYRYFNIYFKKHVYHYHFARGINQTERAKNINKLLAKASMDKNTNMKQIFRQIAHVKPEILDEMMKVIDAIDAFVNENKFVYRIQKYKNDEDFMKSVDDKNPNLDYYESLKKLNAK